MRPIFTISLFIFLSGTLLYGQSVLNDSLLHYEYAYFKNTSDSIKQNILLKKVKLYLNAGLTGPETFNEIKRINYSALNASQIKESFLWNAAVIAYLNDDIPYSRFFLNEYYTVKNDTSISYTTLWILSNKYNDTSKVRERINYLSKTDSLFIGLNCFSDITNFNRKHLNFYLISSAIIPGSGTIMNGAVVKGLISLALAAASVLSIVKMIEYGLYLNAFFWGTGVGFKFYTGNIKLTETVFYKAENKTKNKLTENCKLKLKKILDKYPITLKEL